jgi:hypothetical protein
MQTNPYIPVFFVAWVVLAGGAVLWLSRITDPAAKRTALRSLTLVAIVLFASFVWFLSRSIQGMLYAAPVLALIAYGNFKLVKICNECASINRPQILAPPVHCYRCGAKLP